MKGEVSGTRRQVLVLLLWIGIALLSVELAARVVTTRLSGNLAHVARAPQILAQAARAREPAVLLLGNSLTNNGVDADLLARSLPGLHFAKVTPDATTMWDWQCLLRHQLLQHGSSSVKVVVIGTAWHLLSDQADADASRLGGLYCSYADLLHPARIGASDSGAIGEFITAKTLRLYAVRDTLRNRIFAMTVPHYRRFVAEDNEATAGKPTIAAESTAFTYASFAQLVAELQSRAVRVIVIGMPVTEQYRLDEQLAALGEAGTIVLLDYRQTLGITAASFLDSMHLGPDGSTVLTNRLAVDLARLDLRQ
jgi:hypothetical protein